MADFRVARFSIQRIQRIQHLRLGSIKSEVSKWWHNLVFFFELCICPERCNFAVTEVQFCQEGIDKNISSYIVKNKNHSHVLNNLILHSLASNSFSFSIFFLLIYFSYKISISHLNLFNYYYLYLFI